MRKKLICFDLDGTLLDINKRIPQNNLKVIDALRKNGHIVAIATGRMYKSALKVKNMIPGEVELVASNGAVIEVNNRVISVDRIPLDHHKLIYEILEKYPMPLTFDSLHCAYHTKIGATFRNHRFFNIRNHGDFKIPNIHLRNKEEYLKRAPYFINGIVITRKKKDLLAKLRKELEETNLFTIESSSEDNIEIIPKTSNKGIGTANLGELLGIPQEDIIVFGDAENDIKMIQMAGISIAMGNANDLIKNEADFITKSHMEDGIPFAIENILGIKI